MWNSRVGCVAGLPELYSGKNGESGSLCSFIRRVGVLNIGSYRLGVYSFSFARINWDSDSICPIQIDLIVFLLRHSLNCISCLDMALDN